MKVSDYIMSIGAALIVPICYDLFMGTDALRNVLQNKRKALELIIVSGVLYEIVLVLFKIYRTLHYLPLSARF